MKTNSPERRHFWRQLTQSTAAQLMQALKTCGKEIVVPEFLRRRMEILRLLEDLEVVPRLKFKVFIIQEIKVEREKKKNGLRRT